MTVRVLVGLQPGDKVLIDGERHEARGLVSNGRIFVNPATGQDILLSDSEQRQMSADFRLVLDNLPKDIEEHIASARAANFGAFNFTERTIALRRYRYIQAIDDRPAGVRHKAKVIDECIREVFGKLVLEAAGGISPEVRKDADTEFEDISIVPPADVEIQTRAQVIEKKFLQKIERDTGGGDCIVPPDPLPPTTRSVRRWYRMYYASGRDIRVLLNLHCLKGNDKPRYDPWVVEAIKEVIDAKIAVPEPTRYSRALDLACNAVRESAKDGLPLPELAKKRGGELLLGKNLITRWVRKRDQFELTTNQLGIYEARRRFSAVELGPQGNWPNHEWEVDHTLMDVFVVDEKVKKVYGRPWITAIIDRYSRCIVGYSLTFAAPSWISVMDALRVAVVGKEKIIRLMNEWKHEGGLIRNSWDCHGVPVHLYTDHGREFTSRSFDETMAILGIRPILTKKKKPWLKGKIERWFRELEEEIAHTMPGTTFSKFEKRKFYTSEEFAVITLPQLTWMVTKWIIDVYHQKPHSKLERSPAEMWRTGVKEIVKPRQLPTALLGPVMGVVIDKALRKGGVTYMGLRWDSRKWASLRSRLPPNAKVSVRIDPRDLKIAYIWDEAASDWAEGHLKEPVEAREYRLDQWYYIDTQRKENIEAGMERQEALQQAIADIHQYMDDLKQGLTNSKKYRKYLDFVGPGRSAFERMLPAGFDETDAPPEAHTWEDEPTSEFMKTGPFGEPKVSRETSSEPASSEKSNGSAEAHPSTTDSAAPTTDNADRAADPVEPPQPPPSEAPNANGNGHAPDAGVETTAPPRPDVPGGDDEEYVEDDFSGPYEVTSQHQDDDTEQEAGD